MLPVRRIVVALLWALLMGPALLAQPSGIPDERVLYAHTFKHQPAAEAVEIVRPLLSKRGTVELQPGDNTLVVRDTAAHIKRIAPVLQSYDHPPLPLDLEIFIVKASRSSATPPVRRSGLPEPITRRLREMLPFDIYDIRARAYLASSEGQAVTYGMGKEFEVSFRMGTLVDDGRVRLTDFQVARRLSAGGTRPLIHTTLNLWLDQPMSLGFARSESSREALMVVLSLKRGDARKVQR
ncbi:MAG TPA: secretin N-terminal domain-containing protein [Thermoanaerobaculia bacterium]|nr:secretin N-terminal domain-containing protein [Thermoanaerobaculia bacterium]